ncbi:DUF6316 family protein [Microbulbifer sp. 2201CG32-9]|uniref:DUF6316 family protein n=1 Tax=Microbulbifer sp. 2201CG32-9 TaxID=3232309 RepID=UPI00345B79E9
MQRYRNGEEGQPIPPRSDRFYKVGDDWYFQVRGGRCFGPYPCRSEAEQALTTLFDPRAKENNSSSVVHLFAGRHSKNPHTQSR